MSKQRKGQNSVKTKSEQLFAQIQHIIVQIEQLRDEGRIAFNHVQTSCIQKIDQIQSQNWKKLTEYQSALRNLDNYMIS